MKYLVLAFVCFVFVAGCLGGDSSEPASTPGQQALEPQASAPSPEESESPSMTEQAADSFASLIGNANAHCTYSYQGQSMDVYFLNDKFKVLDARNSGAAFDGATYWVWQGSEGFRIGESFLEEQDADLPTQADIMSADDYAETYANVDLDCDYNVVSAKDVTPPAGIEWQDLEEMMAQIESQMGDACQQCLANVPDPASCEQICNR